MKFRTHLELNDSEQIFEVDFAQLVSVGSFLVGKILFFVSYVIICVQKEISCIICFDSVCVSASLF